MKRVAAAIVLAACLAAAAPAGAAEVKTYRYGPIEVGPYEVNLRDLVYDLPKPDVDGYVTGMEANVVEADGSPIPVKRVMLHHVGFANVGSRVGERRDATCDRFTMLDGRTQNPGYAERFFAVGEERVSADLPDGYGYPVKGADRWVGTWMLMNHTNRRDTVYLEYKVRYETERQLTPVKPVWLDVRNCSFDPIYSVPGGGRRGSTHTETSDWTVPFSGRIVAGIGHVHGGGKDVALSQPDCGDRRLIRSRATWALPQDPEYKVRPLVHEPGPIDMDIVTSRQGFPVSAGQRLRLRSRYDAQLPHTRMMGIMMVFIAPDEATPAGCAPLPGDVRVQRDSRPGRSKVPMVRVPLNGLRRDGRVGVIDRPPGPPELLSGAPVETRDFLYEPANAVVRQGTKVRWRFWGDTLHTVTLASGPEGFGSPNLSDGRVYEKRLKRPGTYRLYCSLHPVGMTGTVRVLPRGRRR